MLGLVLGVDRSPLRRTGSPWWSTSVRLLDGNAPAIVADVPRNGCHTAAGDVSIADVLTVSSASKRVIGPAGMLDTVAANQPAFDWSSGRRRLLIEGKAATKYAPTSEAMGAAPWSKTGCTVAIGAAVGPDGSAGLSVVTEDTSTGFHSISASTGAYVAAAGEFWSCRVAVRNVSGGARYARAVFSGPAFANSYSAVTVDLVTGLIKSISGIANARLRPAANGTWFLEFTAETVASGAIGVLFLSSLTTYVSSYAGDGSSAWAIGYMNLEKVADADAFCSSYVAVPTTSAVTRIADDVRLSTSAETPMQASGGATVVLRGQITGFGNAGRYLGAVSVDASFMLQDGASRTGVGIASSSGGAWLSGVSDMSQPFGCCAAFSAELKKVASNGSSVVSNAMGFPAFSGVRIFGGMIGGSIDGFVDEIVIWPVVGSNAAMQWQAHAWS